MELFSTLDCSTCVILRACIGSWKGAEVNEAYFSATMLRMLSARLSLRGKVKLAENTQEEDMRAGVTERANNVLSRTVSVKHWSLDFGANGRVQRCQAPS